ncbi:MAG: SDR family NAD(P)-dependent oxidoreductase [Nitrospiraceae bacterium]
MNVSFKNTVALVTGSGIGLATAKAFAEAGASVVLAGVHGDVVEEAARQLTAAGHKALSTLNFPKRTWRRLPRSTQTVATARTRKRSTLRSWRQEHETFV